MILRASPSRRSPEEQGLLIPYTALDGTRAELDTTDRSTDFVCETDDAGQQTYKVNGIAVSDETYEQVMAQVMEAWDKIQRGE
jgi:hypothetical protein